MTTRTSLASMLAALVAAPALAAAQPTPAGEPMPAAEEPAPPVDEEPPPPPREEPPPRPRAVARATERSPQPTGYTIGIGIGYDFPAGLDRPDVASVRFRLGSGLTFEPIVVLQGSGSSTEQGPVEVETGAVQLTLGTNVRYPLHTRGPFELLLTGGAAISLSSTDPDGDDNNVSTTTLGLSWGLGVDWWITSHWSLGFTATNPLVNLRSTETEMVGDDQVASESSFGLVFAPNVVMMVHLYY